MTTPLADQQSAIESLCRRCHVRRLDPFGSVATDKANPDKSDYDFLVEFEPLPAGAYADNYFGLLEGMKQLLGSPVDLVAASAIAIRISFSRWIGRRHHCMRLEAKKYLHDMQQAVNALIRFTAGKTFDDYDRDAMLHDGRCARMV